MPLELGPLEAPDRLRNAEPDSAKVAQIRRVMVDLAAPVRPLPSNAALMLLSLAIFVVLAVLLALPFGLYGALRMGLAAAFTAYSVLLLLAAVLAGNVIGQLIPGSKRVLAPSAGALIAILLLIATAALLFPDFSTANYVRQGIPCLRLGLLCSLPAGILVRILMARGFVTNVVDAAVAGGAFAGLLGVAVLALHCPIFNAAHIILWHVGVVAVTSLAGAATGRLLAGNADV